MAAINRPIYPLVVWIAQLFSVAVFVQYLLEIHLQNSSKHWILVAHAIVKFYLFVNFVVAALTDPGIIPHNQWPNAAIKSRKRNEIPKPIKLQIDGTDMELIWCNVCRFHRPPRSVHCDICNYCIEEFDHHCIWLNHCVGRRNYRFFFAFIVLQSIDLILSIGMCATIVKDTNNSILALTLFISIGLLVVVTVPVLGLTTFHAIILLKGQTTHEFVSDADVKVTRVWTHVLFGALYPSLVNRR